MLLNELKFESLRDSFMRQIEEQIISGMLSIGERLPPEREIASKMKISRTIVHSGLIELAARGFITVHPRKGTYVNDYRREGTVAVLDSLFNFTGKLDEEILKSIISTRYLLEVEFARLAAVNRTEENLDRLADILRNEEAVGGEEIDKIVGLDYSFHHEIAMATKNVIYPLIIKSMEGLYKTLVYEFYTKTPAYSDVFKLHGQLCLAIEKGWAKKSAQIMNRILEYGEILKQKHTISNSMQRNK